MQPNNQPDEDLDPMDLAPDPTDPVQGLDDAGGFQIEELGLDAHPDAEAQADLDAAIEEDDAEEDEEENNLALDGDTPADTTADVIEATQGRKDVGELYGVHVPPAAEPVRDIESQSDTGENWLEALEGDAAENGPAPEHILDVTDDQDAERPHHKSDTRDRPVADKGSGGPGGL